MRSRLASWPKRLSYPLVGMLLSVSMVAGLLTLQGWLTRRAPTASWVLAELRGQPFVYAYLLVATLIMMSILGWIVGRKEDLLEELSVTDPLTGLANRRRLRAGVRRRERARRSLRDTAGAAADRSRQPQADQRPPRPRQRRQRAAARRREPAGELPRHRPRGPLRRRRVHRPRGQHLGDRGPGAGAPDRRHRAPAERRHRQARQRARAPPTHGLDWRRRFSRSPPCRPSSRCTGRPIGPSTRPRPRGAIGRSPPRPSMSSRRRGGGRAAQRATKPLITLMSCSGSQGLGRN